MKITVAILLSCLVLASAWGAQATVPRSEVTVMAQANNAFALKLYRELTSTGGNVFFSPYSLESAMAMTYLGARANTARQMAEVLGFTLDQSRLHPAMAGLARILSAAAQAKDQKLTIANALWMDRKLKLLTSFTGTLKANYGAPPWSVDFSQPDQAAAAINRWVNRHTQSMIKELVVPSDLQDALLVLTNAIYFQGKWVKPFKRSATRLRPFFLSPGRTAQAPMMHQASPLAYAEDASTQVLAMPYRGDGLELVVLLPKAKHGLAALEASLTPQSLAAKMAGLRVQMVSVAIPRLKMETTYRLKQTLVKLGMADAFDRRRADFSGMTGTPYLMIDKVIHKARLELDEQGTKAAAATAVVMKPRSAAPRPAKAFIADHPFIFMIRHRPTGAIVFMGRVTNPNG